METAVVIPVGGGRLNNLLYVLDTIAAQTVQPRGVILVCDGEEAWIKSRLPFRLPTAVMLSDKHEPGKDQPRNRGVRMVEELAQQRDEFKGIDSVWFLDTDVIVDPGALAAYEHAMELDPTPRVLIGPYEWLPPKVRKPVRDIYNDPRWESFNRHGPGEVVREDLSAGLANFSGNLIWPISEFQRVGGFWNELHHGRCEDGELGLRAVAMGVPMSFVREARGWHLEHPRNIRWIEETNAIDVPKLNERHPWVQGEGLFVVEEDGKRFNARCKVCGHEMNTAEIWAHMGQKHPDSLGPLQPVEDDG